MQVILLIVTVFFYGLGNEPKTVVMRAPSAAVCAADAPKLKAQLEADDKVRDAEVRCVQMDQKDKS